jgi:ribosomal protein S18 acetylase RimI-like enzyme
VGTRCYGSTANPMITHWSLVAMASEGVEIRPLRAADMGAVRWLHTFLEVHYPEDFYGELLDGSGPKDVLSMDPPRSVICLVAVAQDEVVGVGTARVSRAAHPWGMLGDALDLVCGCCGACVESEPAVGYVMSIIVAPSHRGKGVARRLLTALHKQIQAVDDFGPVRHILLHCLPSNVAARALYRSVGYVETRRMLRYYYFEGAYHDALELSFDPLAAHQATSDSDATV